MTTPAPVTPVATGNAGGIAQHILRLAEKGRANLIVLGACLRHEHLTGSSYFLHTRSQQTQAPSCPEVTVRG